MGTIDAVWDFYVGQVHHNVILGMPWVTDVNGSIPSRLT